MNSDKSSLDINNLQFRLTELWGPTQDDKIEEFADQPFTPFNRSKLNLAPFNTQILQEQYAKATGRTYYQNQYNNQNQGIKLEQDDFDVVETKQKVLKPYQRKTYNKKQPVERKQDLDKKVIIKKARKKKLNHARNYIKVKYVQFKDSVFIKSKFKPLSELDKTIFDKTKVKDVEIEEVCKTGILKEYNNQFERIQVKSPWELKNWEKYPKLANSNAQKDDKMMEILEEAVEQQNQEEEDYRKDQIRIQNRKQARQEKKKQQNEQQQQEGEEEEEEDDEEENKGDVPPPSNHSQVYITDTLLTGLMTLNNSEFPWNITVVKDGNHLIMDKFHQDQQTYLDYQTMHENSTAANILPQDENEIQKICLETTSIQQTLLKQATQPREDSKEWDYGEENENVLEGFEDQNVAFRYIKVKIDDEMVINVRTQIDAFQTNSKGEQIPILIRSFNEYQPGKTEWRKNLVQSIGSLTSQLQIFNLCQMNKWLIQMYLSDADKIKVAYVSRNARQPENSQKHQILKVVNYSYDQFQQEQKIRPSQCWNIVKHIVNYLSNQQDGKYLLLKHAYKSSIKFYYVPENDDSDDDDEDVFDQEGDDNEEDSGDEEEQE